MKDKARFELENKKLQGITRRHFLFNAATGIGGIALGSLMGCGLTHRDTTGEAISNALAFKSSPFSAQGETCHLFAYGRCTISTGIV